MNSKKIPVVIFCGGQGTRMKEETEFRPKPMVTLGGKPILWHIMKIYSHFGYNNFIIALGYKGDYIKDYFISQEYFENDFQINTKTGKRKLHKNNRRRKDDFNITFVDTGVETLTGERLLKVKRYIKSSEFMVTYGDGVGNVDISDLVNFHRGKKLIGVLTGVHPKSKWGLIISGKDRIVKEFRQKPKLNQYVNGGFMMFNKDFFKYVKPREMIEVALERLLENKQLAVYIHDGYWSAMDTYQDVEEMNRQWKKDPKWKIWR
jgi:glucose-1-phosphate cytidylyltransferase